MDEYDCISMTWKWQPSQEGYGNFYVQVQEQIKLVFTINQDCRVVILAILF